MKQTFIVEKGNQGSSDFIILPTGLDLPITVPVLLNFDNTKVIGQADVFLKNNVVYATAEVADEYKDLYPAIGISTASESQGTGTRVITKAKVMSISFSGQRNADESIESLGKQADNENTVLLNKASK